MRADTHASLGAYRSRRHQNQAAARLSASARWCSQKPDGIERDWYRLDAVFAGLSQEGLVAYSTVAREATLLRMFPSQSRPVKLDFVAATATLWEDWDLASAGSKAW